jgi:acyl-CoA synthetase (AMP-forming)/AMP-acid ligase II
MNIAMLLDMAVAGDPERIVVGSRNSGMTATGLRRTAAGAARVIRENGAKAIVFAGLNGPAFPVLLFGSALAGVPLIPVNYRLSADALLDLLNQVERPLVVADNAYLPVFAESGAEVLSTGAMLSAARNAEPVEGEGAGEDDPAVLLFTSGTTSAPKAAVLRQRHLTSYILQTVEFASSAAEDAVLVSVPPYHVAGVGSALSNLYAGRRIIHLPDFDAGAWLRTVVEEGVTSAMLVPTMLARIVEHLKNDPVPVPTLRSLAYGGARMPPTVLEAALALFPNTGFVNAYGLTETSSTIALLGPEDHRGAFASDDPRVRARLGSAGRMVPGVEAQIRSTSGEVLPQGASGELWVRGPQVSGEYRGAAPLLDEGGWFRTRDLARFDEDGFLFIEGRADDTIIRGGENIAPAEIEDVLVRHPDVKEAAVCGVPDEEWGERIAAVIVPHPGSPTDGDALRAYVRERLRGSKTPDLVVFREELPYTPTGKLLRRELVAALSG